MATRRIIPPDPDRSGPREINQEAEANFSLEQEKETRKLVRSLRRMSAAQIIVAAAVIIAICYVAKIVFVTLMVSMLLAFMLDPLVNGLVRIRVPRALGSALAVLLLLAIVYGASYFFYGRALSFIQELPKYSQQIRSTLSPVMRRTNQIKQVTQKVLPQENNGKQPIPVTVTNDGHSNLITDNLSLVTEAALTLAFIPFLVYFMLSWQEHARTQTVQLFPAESRTTAYVTLGQISLMMRSFINGNFIVGLFLGICSVVVFGFLKLPYFYFLGLISGFLSLIPYLGVVLALVPPLAAGIGTLTGTGMIIVAVTVLALHLVATNVLYPKFIGKRLQLNPLVVTIGLLIWGFVWGAMGLVLAIPMLGVIKIICDHVPDLRAIGAWMGE